MNGSHAGDQPNILLLTLDTLRLNRLGCYGAQRQLTPHLDQLAQGSLCFEQAISGGSWTLPASVSMRNVSSFCQPIRSRVGTRIRFAAP